MFDIGFPELLLVSVVALLVIGPERLPETVRTISLWVGRLKRSLAHIREEIEAEVGAEQIRQQLRDESVLQGLEETKKQIEGMIDDTRDTFDEVKAGALDSKGPASDQEATTNPTPVDEQRAGQAGE